MWKKTYSQNVTDLDAASLWRAWSDVNRWTEWQDDIESARLAGPFVAGGSFMLRPKGGPNVKVTLLAVEPGIRFTDLTKFPLAEMVGDHELIVHGKTVEVRTTISVRGPLAFLWIRLVASGVVDGLPEQTRRLIERAGSLLTAPRAATAGA
jgi:hypothetical protein